MGSPPEHRPKRGDLIAIAILLGIPLVALSAAALSGYPLLTGDAVVQGYPLSVLSAQIISHGHLPLYDPYSWAGTPLLAGGTAHALLPSTLLFTILPDLAAWVVAETLTLVAGAIGCFVLLRRNGCRPLAAALGGATFGLGGYLSSQLVHIDFVSAAASLVWCLVALDGIARDQAGRWAAVLAVAVACLGLSASPDIVIDAVVGVVAYGAHLLISVQDRRFARIGWAAAGGLTGLALSAVQWLTTAHFVSVSERAHAGYAFASAGSASFAELLISVVPHVLGGGPIGLERYTGPYSLAELDAYCGILSLVAVVSLAARWRSGNAHRWRIWYLIGGAGLLLALGASTPLEHVLVHLPVVGKQRLPSRALVLVSLASSMLLGYWIEEQLAAERTDRRWAATAAGTVAPIVVLGLIAATALSGKPYGGLLDAMANSGWSLRAVTPYLVVTSAIALAACVVVTLGPSWTRQRRAWAITALVVMDLLVFTANQSSLAPIYARALGVDNRLQAELTHRLRDGGRFLVVDPARSTGIASDEVGVPNLGALFGLPSAQGYGSLIWGPYEWATGTHSQDDLEPAALATDVFDKLDVRVLLTVPNELSYPTTPGPLEPAAGTTPGLGEPPVAGDGPVPSPIILEPRQVANRWFGRALVVRTVALELSSRLPSSSGLEALGRGVLLVPKAGPDDVPGTAAAVVAADGSHTLVVSFRSRRPSTGLLIKNPLGISVRIATVVTVTRAGASYGLDGALAAYLTQPRWIAAGTIGPFAVFANQRALGAFWLAGSHAGARPSLAVRVIRSSPWTPTETVAVTTSGPATVLRSVAAIPGWRATEDKGARAIPLALDRDGLVQSFAVGRGTTIITFTYDPPGLRLGLLGSALGAAGLLVLATLAATGAVTRRRKGRRD